MLMSRTSRLAVETLVEPTEQGHKVARSLSLVESLLRPAK